MDLTRLYNLTTRELRDEAERLGVDDTYAMSRGQLIHAIRNRAGGPDSEGLLGKVLGFAKWALQAAQEEPRRAVGSRPPQGRAPASVSQAPEQEGKAKRFGRPAEAPLPSVGRESGSGSEPGSAPMPAWQSRCQCQRPCQRQSRCPRQSQRPCPRQNQGQCPRQRARRTLMLGPRSEPIRSRSSRPPLGRLAVRRLVSFRRPRACSTNPFPP